MDFWLSEASGAIPSPELVAAWVVLDVVPTERVPLWAAHWLAAEYDGEALVALAGLHGDNPHDVRDLLTPALAECSVASPDLEGAAIHKRRAAAVTAFAALAKMQVEGRASERWIVGKVLESVEPDFPEDLTTLPLGRIWTLDGEWGAGWGRTDDELRAEVRKACAQQLQQ